MAYCVRLLLGIQTLGERPQSVLCVCVKYGETKVITCDAALQTHSHMAVVAWRVVRDY